MEILVIGAWIVVIVAHAVWSRPGTRDRSRWEALVKMCDLTEARPLSRFTGSWSARQGELEVVFEAYNRHDTFARFKIEKDRGPRAARVRVRGISPTIELKPEWLGSHVIGKALGQSEIEVGDPAFDRSLYVRGAESVLSAVLDSETRALLVDAFAGRVVPMAWKRIEMTMEIRAGEIVAEFEDDVEANAEPLPETVRCLLALARRLQAPSDVSARLADIARHDPLPAVRRNVLRTMERTAPTEPATRAAFECAARDDPDGEVRLQAALWLGGDGWPMLEGLAQDATLDDSLCARAIGGLGEHMALDRASSVLEASMAAGRLLTAKAAVKVLGWGGEAQVPLLASVMDRAPELAAEAASALGQIGSPSAEAPLIATLRIPSPDLRAAAAAALGRLGSAAAVEPLRELARVAWGTPRNEALAAIVRIQRRLTGADPGQLSMVEAADGQLALADDKRGRMTLPDSKSPS